MIPLKHAVKKILKSFSWGRILLNQMLVWHYLQVAKKTAKPLGIKVRLSGDKLVVQKDDRVLAVASKHLIYSNNLVLDFNILYEAVESEKSADGQLVDYSIPRWHKLSGSGRRVFLTSFSEGESVNTLYLKHGKVDFGGVVLDLGANCGLAALSFAEVVGHSGQVVSIEPDAANFDALLKNLGFHQIKNVHALCAGAWSSTGHIDFDADGSMGATVVKDSDYLPRGQITRIPVISLLDVVEQFKLPKVDLVKMDIEGAEFEVILSAGSFLDRYRARWVVEVHDPDRIGLLTTVFQAKNYVTEIINQSQSHDYPLLIAFPKADL
jgi:FkbM family methyltransferase